MCSAESPDIRGQGDPAPQSTRGHRQQLRLSRAADMTCASLFLSHIREKGVALLLFGLTQYPDELNAINSTCVAG